MPTLAEVRKRLESKRFTTRKRGMQELLALGLRDELIERALADKDGALVSHVVTWLEPDVPAKLLVHNFHLGRQPVPLSEIRSYLPYHNCLYAEKEIFEHYAPQGRKLALMTIEAVGYGYLRSFEPLLRKVADRKLEVAQDAVDRDGKRALVGGENAFTRVGPHEVKYTDLPNEWSTESQKVLEALVALRRLDHTVAPELLERLKTQVRALAPEGSPLRQRTMHTLDWVAFDGLPDAAFADLLASGGEGLPNVAYWAADIGTSLLKRGMADRLAKLMSGMDPFRFYSVKFCHWPLTEHLDRTGLLPLDPEWFQADTYLKNRERGIAGPPWAKG